MLHEGMQGLALLKTGAAASRPSSPRRGCRGPRRVTPLHLNISLLN